MTKTSNSTNASSSIPTPAISDEMEEEEDVRLPETESLANRRRRRPASGGNGLPPQTEAMETDDDSLLSCVIGEKQCLIAAGRNRTNEKRNNFGPRAVKEKASMRRERATRCVEMEALDVILEQWQRTGFLSAEGMKEVYYDCANDKCGGCSSILLLHQAAPRNELVMEILDRRVSNVVEV